jgi:hypothetical protein
LGVVNQNLAKLQRRAIRRSVKLDLTDLSKFQFKGDNSPNEASNLSNWVEGLDLVTEFTEGERVVSDKGLIKAEPFFTTEGFSLR